MSEVTIENVGPIEKFEFKVPEDGGVVVLKGKNGAGKSHALAAIEAVSSGKSKPVVRDGAPRATIEGFGVTMKVGRSARKSGELEVHTLEGRLNVADLVDPGLKSQEAADTRRIKALISLSGTKPDPALFESLFASADEFRAVVSASTLETDDVVLLAERIKRDCEAAARKEESQAERAAGEAKGKQESARGVPIDADADPVYLQKQLEEAIQHQAELATRKEEHDKNASRREMALEAIEKLKSQHDGKSVEEHRQALRDAEATVDAMTERVRELEDQLAKAKIDLEVACTEQAAAVRELKAAERYESTIAQYESVVNDAIPEAPSDEELEQADASVIRAREAVERGALVRRAKSMLREAEVLKEKSSEHSRRADALREAARGTDNVLSELVASTGSQLRVEAGRLVLDTDRGTELYCDLSEGERWRVALEIAISAVGDNGLIVIPQDAWEGLDADVRNLINSLAKQSRVVIVTAEADHDEPVGDLRAETFA